MASQLSVFCAVPLQKEFLHAPNLMPDDRIKGVRKIWRRNLKKHERVTASASYKGLPGKSTGRKISVTPLNSSVATDLFTLKPLKKFLDNIFGPTTTPDEVQINATLIVEKKSILRLLDIGADLVDNVEDKFGRKVALRLVSVQVNPETDTGKESKIVEIRQWFSSGEELENTYVQYKFQFKVDRDFGVPGAFIVENHHHNEFYLKSLALELPDETIVRFPCNSWIYNKYKYPNDRVFFSNEVYLPEDTPVGLWKLREQELMGLRGDGKGERKEWDRIYDYDVYNDLGNPDKDKSLMRPVLGGSKELPYPRRCRTGRPPSKTDPLSESLVVGMNDNYVPRDERFSPVKSSGFLADTVKSAAHAVVPALEAALRVDEGSNFSSFHELAELYDEMRTFVKQKGTPASKSKLLQKVEFELKTMDEAGQDILAYPIPQIIAEDATSWMEDKEFARQMLAGLNPMVIKCLEVFPPRSKLDPTIYGTHTSALKASHIESQLEGITIEQALESKKLFILDYYDIFMPFLNEINAHPKSSAKTYASRTIFYYSKDNTLKPVAIELSLPPRPTGSTVASFQRTFTPPAVGNAKDWLWELAKAHVKAHHSNYHQLISHWLETHATVEPFIIATYRQLSALHPLHPFLFPHFKNTMSINSQARKALINADGIIEKCFIPGPLAIQMSAVIYKEYWHFDKLALPTDLLNRGMAISDASTKHGLKLVIEDYPYAHDGLEIWHALREWVHEYIHIYYKSDDKIKMDSELQLWWNEIRTKGHEDKKHDSGWIKLDTRENLEEILTTLIWITSAHHAAVNFGQYAYAGYMPNNPTSTQRFIPENDSIGFVTVNEMPEKHFLSTLSTKLQATIVMTTVEILSTHSTEEEYIGQRAIKDWTNNKEVIDAFGRFSMRMNEIENLIERRNKDLNLKNRRGSVNVPYTLLHPSSQPGITGRGVPNSISI